MFSREWVQSRSIVSQVRNWFELLWLQTDSVERYAPLFDKNRDWKCSALVGTVSRSYSLNS